MRGTWYRALAVTKRAAGTVAKNGQTSSRAYTNFQGKPAPALLNWFPKLAAGSYTGQEQAAWSVVGNSKYISLGGEFPRVNDAPQQGLVRMAIPSIAPNKVGPIGVGAMTPSATAQPDGMVALEWGQLWDRDDLTLAYKVTRNGTTIDTRTVSVPFWNRSRMTFVDKTAASAGSSALRYELSVSDPSGNIVTYVLIVRG